MAWKYEKEENGDTAIVISGFESGIAPSPHKGFGDMKNVNIATESGEVMANYIRTQQAQTQIAGQALTISNTNTLLNTNSGSSQQVQNGTWITISGSSGTPANGTYYVFNTAGTTGQTFQIATTFGGTALTGFSGSIGTFTTINMGQPKGSAIEYIADGSFRYYVLDALGYVWMHDSGNSAFTWALINGNDTAGQPSPALASNIPNGIAVYNGWLQVWTNSRIFVKPTVALSTDGQMNTNRWGAMTGVLNTNANANYNAPHYALVGHDSICYYCDGQFVGSIFANASGNATNLFSYSSYTASGTSVTLGTVYGGNVPIEGLPIQFFASAGGTLPTAITNTTTTYYVKTGSLSYSGSVCTFQVAATAGGVALDMATGASGTQYFNTYNPASSTTFVWSQHALALPITDTAQCLAELGTDLVVGTSGNTLFTWDRFSANPSGYIFLPESNVPQMVTTNNMVHVFAGNKGNIYITNGSTASLVLSIPDYISGQIEPYFTWGGAMYLRGRVYFSVQQGSGTANVGGIWSFVPTQNFFIGQDFGTALRLENQNSYGTYNGKATLLFANQTQAAQFPQYWSVWDNGSSGYGIDYTGTVPYSSSTPGTASYIETDIIPVGTMLEKKTFKQLEYKLAAPLATGESIVVYQRGNLTDSFTIVGSTLQQDSTTSLSGYYPCDFEKGQWLQLRILLVSTTSNPSFVRLTEFRVR